MGDPLGPWDPVLDVLVRMSLTTAFAFSRHELSIAHAEVALDVGGPAAEAALQEGALRRDIAEKQGQPFDERAHWLSLRRSPLRRGEHLVRVRYLPVLPDIIKERDA